MNRTILVGSRNSALAIAQARIVIDAVKKTNPSLNFEFGWRQGAVHQRT